MLSLIFGFSICGALRLANIIRKAVWDMNANPEILTIGSWITPFNDKGHAVLKHAACVNGCEAVSRGHSCCL